MVSRDEKSLEEARWIIEEIKRLGWPILVEGRRDEKALRTLGITNDVHRIQESGSFAKVVESLKKKGCRTAIILTDPDKEGAAIAHRTASALEDFGMHPEMGFRKMTKLLGKAAVEQIRDTDVG